DDESFAGQKLAKGAADDLFVLDDKHLADVFHGQLTSVETRVDWATSGCCRTLSHVRKTVNFVPCGDVSVSSIRPSPDSSIMCLQTNRPSPVPVSFVVK